MQCCGAAMLRCCVAAFLRCCVLDEEVHFVSKLIIMRRPKPITSLFCIPEWLWMNGHAQMIVHVIGEKHRNQFVRWMQLDLNRATPVERVTPEMLQRALFELTDMFAS